MKCQKVSYNFLRVIKEWVEEIPRVIRKEMNVRGLRSTIKEWRNIADIQIKNGKIEIAMLFKSTNRYHPGPPPGIMNEIYE